MNNFDKLKDIAELHDYTPRHDPTVTVTTQSADSPVLASAKELPAPQKRKNEAAFYTSADFVALYTAGTLTPVDVVEHLLPLIRRDTKPPGKYSIGWVSVRADLILEAAKASAERYKVGKPLGPLDGVPIAVKDSFDITGYKQTQGTVVDFTGPGDKTAWVVEKWQEAGAIILGKTISKFPIRLGGWMICRIIVPSDLVSRSCTQVSMCWAIRRLVRRLC